MEPSEIPPSRQPKKQPNILDMRDVSLRVWGSKIGRIRRFDLQIPAGEAAVILRPSGVSKQLIVEAAAGMLEPRHGEIRFKNVCWKTASYKQQMTMRSRIGRVFDRGGWISNLSVIDNIKLGLRHHTIQSERVIEKKVARLMEQFGVEIPSKRAAFTEPGMLRIYQWVRAFLIKPDLLVAHRPLNGVPDAHHKSFVEAEVRHRKSGGATIWLTDNPFVWQRTIGENVVRYKIESDRIVRLER